MPDPQPTPDRPRESHQERERRYELIADALREGADAAEIALALGVSRREVIPMIGAARRWQQRRDAADASVREALYDDMVYELCDAVCEAGAPVSAEQLSAGPLGASGAWTPKSTATMLEQAASDGFLRRLESGAFELTVRGVVRSQCYRQVYEQPVELEIDGRALTWDGHEQARALARRVALQRWRVTRISPDASYDTSNEDW
ncbi:MAG: hypothetical protein ABSG43_26185 [Solirubrobacteraceae bacterium]